MPQVPYAPVPSVAPTEAATPAPGVPAPPEAFGLGIAQGLEKVGASLGQAGNELFGRAVALQQLNNETEAREADAQYMIQAGDLHAKYNALQGKDRVDAFPKYSQDLQDLRIKIRGGLSNPMAQKMYDASSLSTMGRSIFNGAGSAATANKEWQAGVVQGQFNLNAKTAEDNPNDEGLFQQKLSQVDSDAATLAGIKGFGVDDAYTKDLASKMKSHLASQRVIGMARNQPYQASQLLAEYKAKGLLYGDDVDRVTGKVQALTHTVGMATLADQVLGKYRQPDGTFTKSFTDMQQEAKDQATKLYPDDPAIGPAAAAAIDRNYNQLGFASRVDNQDVAKQIASYIVKGVTDTSMLPADLVNRMSPKQLKDFPAQANAYNHSIEVQTNQDQYHKLLGLYNNDNGKFMETNILQVPGLSKSNINFFLGLQRKTEANGDPRVAAAMKKLVGAVPQSLADLGVIGAGKTEDDKNKFTGALHDAIQSWQETYGKAPSEEELVKKIFPSLIMQTVDPDKWFGRTSEVFRAGVPEDAVNAIKADHPNQALTDEQIRNEYLRTQFNAFYAKTRTKSQDRVK